MLQIVHVRHNTGAESDELILDAARHLILRRGISRTTLTDVAAQAGLSRMTVYRRWNNLPTLLGATMQREWQRLLGLDDGGLADRVEAGPTAREGLIRELIAATRTLRESELLTQVREVEPQLLLPYLIERSGRLQSGARGFVSDILVRGQHDGSVGPGDPDRMAAAVVLAMQSWVLSMATAGDEIPARELDDELAQMLDSYLTTGTAP